MGMVKEFLRDNLVFVALLAVIAIAAETDAGVTVGLVVVALGVLAGTAYAARQDGRHQRRHGHPSF